MESWSYGDIICIPPILFASATYIQVVGCGQRSIGESLVEIPTSWIHHHIHGLSSVRLLCDAVGEVGAGVKPSALRGELDTCVSKYVNFFYIDTDIYLNWTNLKMWVKGAS